MGCAKDRDTKLKKMLWPSFFIFLLYLEILCEQYYGNIYIFCYHHWKNSTQLGWEHEGFILRAFAHSYSVSKFLDAQKGRDTKLKKDATSYNHAEPA